LNRRVTDKDMTTRGEVRLQWALAAILLAIAWVASPLANAQAAPASRFVGSITAINGTTLTVKTDAGELRQVEVPSEASLKRIAPGQKDLSTASTVEFGSLAVGDRVLVKIDPSATGTTPQAAQIIAIKQEDVAQKQQRDREDWQRRGVGGLVKSVDASTGVILLTTGVGETSKTIAIKATRSTILKRYSPQSVRFDDAQPAPIDAIHQGDQLRARGDKNANGTEIIADEVVSGSFRNIAGTISSIDTSASTLVVKDLATKKMVTIKITSDAQMKRLPERMAQNLAARLKAGVGAPSGGAASQNPAGGAPGGQQHSWGGGSGGPGSGPGTGAGNASSQGGAPGGGSGDPQQMLSRAPTIALTDLQKGEAVMLVATEGATDVTAVTLLAGVEPLLQAPAASQNLLSNWSMGGGGSEGGGSQ